MAKKQINTFVANGNISAAAAAAVREEKAIVSKKRAPVAKKHSKAAVTEVLTEPASLAKTAPDRAKVAELAYLYSEARGFQSSAEEEKQDWLRAEAALGS